MPNEVKETTADRLSVGQLFRTERLDRCTDAYRRVKCNGEFRVFDVLVIALVEGKNNIVFFAPNEVVIPINETPT